MSDQVVQPSAEVAPGLTQIQRVINIFAAPSKTFDDIKAGNKSWWMPSSDHLALSATSFLPPSTPKSA